MGLMGLTRPHPAGRPSLGDRPDPAAGLSGPAGHSLTSPSTLTSLAGRPIRPASRGPVPRMMPRCWPRWRPHTSRRDRDVRRRRRRQAGARVKDVVQQVAPAASPCRGTGGGQAPLVIATTADGPSGISSGRPVTSWTGSASRPAAPARPRRCHRPADQHPAADRLSDARSGAVGGQALAVAPRSSRVPAACQRARGRVQWTWRHPGTARTPD